MKRILLAFMMFCLCCAQIMAAKGAKKASACNAKGSYRISLSAPQLAKDSIFLAAYISDKIYSSDTVRLDANGNGVFKKNKKLEEGLYLIYIGPKNKFYEFLVGSDQNINITLKDTTKTVQECMKVTGAEESVAFADFGNYMTSKRTEQEEIMKDIRAVGNNEAKKKVAEDKMKSLDKEVVDHQTALADQYNGRMMGLFVRALIEPKYPDNLAGTDTSRTYQMARYQYAKKHYFDNVDIADHRVWRMNMINKRLDNFTNNWLIQIPDSVIPDVIGLIEKSKTKHDSIAYSLMCNYMINFSVRSKVMGMDKLFLAIADKYYFTGQAPWADSTIMANVTSEAKKCRYNIIGMKAANLPLVKLDGSKFNLYDINSKYTLVYFFEPTCGHCKVITPKLHDNVYQKFKDKGFEVVCVYLMTDPKEWKDFLNLHQLYGDHWINAWDPQRESYYWQFFDTSTTPGVYLLDKDKKIIAKKIDMESLDRILDYEINGVKRPLKQEVSED